MEIELAKNQTGLIQNVDDLSRIGKMMSTSGYFEDARDAAKAAVKISAGMELGFGPFASMTGIHIIKGRPAIGANLMAAAVKANPRYDYRVTKMSDEEVVIDFYERIDGKPEKIGVSSFSVKDATKAGTQNMGKFPRNMLFARAMSNGIRWFCPDVFSGNVTYTPEELGAEVDGEGNVISEPAKVNLEPERKADTPVEATQEAVIEGEILHPINNTPGTEKPVEAQEKAKFDEIEFLRNWKHRAGLPPMTLEEACQMKDSKGKEYGTMAVERLYWMLTAIEKKLPTVSAEAKEHYLFKISAINEIFEAKANAQKKLDEPANPFVKKEA